ncbi:hypothetical protein [Nostoc linckia]|nr:hypothetical protein [Nostoc linckia]
MGRWGDEEMGRWGDEEMGRWGDESLLHLEPLVPNAQCPMLNDIFILWTQGRFSICGSN